MDIFIFAASPHTGQVTSFPSPHTGDLTVRGMCWNPQLIEKLSKHGDLSARVTVSAGDVLTPMTRLVFEPTSGYSYPPACKVGERVTFIQRNNGTPPVQGRDLLMPCLNLLFKPKLEFKLIR